MRLVLAQRAGKWRHGRFAGRFGHAEFRQQVGHDVVVVAGVERNLAAASRFRHAAHDVERLVAIERRDLDGDDVGNPGELCPEGARQHASAHGRLQIKAEEGNFARDGFAMGKQLFVGGLP